ncbi:uncharacterized protein PV09_06764 [Verruconis gallopava]|uniref:DNA-directed RNA polymerase I subunit RPA12 n=1 Tax=Verruconis gallopava TaxID=253628 RepID=A0A0D2A599_9PEZI|nr:uncharacterized protein PV09_06764 [Verruconis gallopava]KIW01923.1 hypothetical protein PV09_06764 [Verruconis gallopava]
MQRMTAIQVLFVARKPESSSPFPPAPEMVLPSPSLCTWCDVVLGQLRLNPFVADTSAKTIVTVSKPTSFPSKLRDKLSGDVQAVGESSKDNEQEASEPCEKCGAYEVRFHTLQIRSADEGSTVFYTCHKCGHKWNTNN